MRHFLKKISESTKIEVIIKLVEPHEATTLSELAFLSKSYWPYDKNKLKAYKNNLDITSDYLQTKSVFGAYLNNKVVGFYGLASNDNCNRLY